MIRLDGAAAVKERLDAMTAALRQVLKGAVETEAAELADEAKRRCPEDTGGLRESIRAELRIRGDTVEAKVGSDLDYAADVELGTLKKPPAPYLAPAVDTRRGAVSERIRRAVRGALEGETE
jgi:HK97 gp10 family phage protein